MLSRHLLHQYVNMSRKAPGKCDTFLYQTLHKLWACLLPNNSMEQSPSWKANSSSTSQEITCILWDLKVHYHLSLSYARSMHSIPNPNSLRSILVVSSHLRLDLLSSLFPSGFPTNNLYVPFLSNLVSYILKSKWLCAYVQAHSHECNFTTTVTLPVYILLLNMSSHSLICTGQV
jgi:hypothetical protein